MPAAEPHTDKGRATRNRMLDAAAALVFEHGVAGTIDEHVDAVDLLGQALDVVEVLEVGADETNASAVGCQRVGDPQAPLVAAPGDHYVCALRGVGAGDRLADPRGAAGHEHRLAMNGHVLLLSVKMNFWTLQSIYAHSITREWTYRSKLGYA